MASSSTMVLPGTNPLAPPSTATASVFDNEPFDVADNENNQSEQLSTVASSDEFDPFNVAAPGNAKNEDGGPSPKSDQVMDHQSAVGAPASSKGTTALPPRIVVKFMLQEEVMSGAIVGTENEGASTVCVHGTLHAQVTSSDAHKNSPFVLVGSAQTGSKLLYTPNGSYSKIYSSKGGTSRVNVVKIPKNVIGFVEVGSYTIKETVDHMPLLLERKVSRVRSFVHVAIQVRSKLSNRADLSDFSVGLAMPVQALGSSVEVLTGEGSFDELKRTVTWSLQNLPKGASFMVSTRFKVEGATSGEKPIDLNEMAFPVMLRCTSHDQISSAQFQAVEASGYPASVTYLAQTQSFRMIHRLK